MSHRLSLRTALFVLGASLVAGAGIVGARLAGWLQDGGVFYAERVWRLRAPTDLTHAAWWVWVLGVVVATALGGSALWLAIRRKGTRSFIIAEHGAGDGMSGGFVAVRQESLQALLAHQAELVPGVLRGRGTVKLARGGWRIDVHLALRADSDIQREAQLVRRVLSESFMQQTGISVERMRTWVQLGQHNRMHRVL